MTSKIFIENQDNERVELNAHNFKVIVSTEDMKKDGVPFVRIELANGEGFDFLANFDDLGDNHISLDLNEDRVAL